MEKVLVSACLVGERVRYDGIVKSFGSHVLKSWNHQGRVVAICPEVAGGLPVPRRPVRRFVEVMAYRS